MIAFEKARAQADGATPSVLAAGAARPLAISQPFLSVSRPTNPKDTASAKMRLSRAQFAPSAFPKARSIDSRFFAQGHSHRAPGSEENLRCF